MRNLSLWQDITWKAIHAVSCFQTQVELHQRYVKYFSRQVLIFWLNIYAQHFVHVTYNTCQKSSKVPNLELIASPVWFISFFYRVHFLPFNIGGSTLFEWCQSFIERWPLGLRPWALGALSLVLSFSITIRIHRVHEFVHMLDNRHLIRFSVRTRPCYVELP